MRGMGHTKWKTLMHTRFWFLENQKERGCVEGLGTELRKILTLRRLMSYIYIYLYIWSTHS